MSDDEELGNRFRAVRLKSCLNQKDFAKSIGMSQSFIADIERGAKEPSRSILVAIAREYKVSLDWLLLGIDTDKSVEVSTKNNDVLLSQIETLKKENSALEEEVRNIEATCKRLDEENREINKELVERLRQLVTIQNQHLGLI